MGLLCDAPSVSKYRFIGHYRRTHTGVNAAGDAGDTSPPIFWLVGTSTGISPPILLRTFGYSRPLLVALRSLSLTPISFGYSPPIRFSQAGGQSAHPPNLELALTPLCDTTENKLLIRTEWKT